MKSRHLICLLLLGPTAIPAVPCNVDDKVQAFYAGSVEVDAAGNPIPCKVADDRCWFAATIAGRDASDDFTVTWADGDVSYARIHAHKVRLDSGELCDATHQTHIETMPVFDKAQVTQAARSLMKALTVAGFAEEEIRARLKGPWKWRGTFLDSRCQGTTEGLDASGLSDKSSSIVLDDPLSDLLRLFVLHMAVPASRVAQVLGGSKEVKALEDLGLLVTDDRTQLVRSFVQIFEVDGILTVTDWQCTTKPTHGVDPVMPIGLDSVALARIVPRDPVSTLLDVCTGSGIQGLVAAKHYTNEVTLLDVNPRATRFAKFNIALNGLESKVRVLAPGTFNTHELTSRTFDRIVGNPPFNFFPDHYFKKNMAARELFSDGGHWGEDVISQIIGNSTAQLAPGGSLFLGSMSIMNIDTYGHRVAQWWTQAGGGKVDVIVAHSQFKHPIAYAVSTLLGSEEDFAWLEAEGVRNFVRGILAIHGRPASSVVSSTYGSALLAQLQESGKEENGKVPVTLIDIESSCGGLGGLQLCTLLSERLKMPLPDSTTLPPTEKQIPSLLLQPDGKVLAKQLPPDIPMAEAKRMDEFQQLKNSPQ